MRHAARPKTGQVTRRSVLVAAMGLLAAPALALPVFASSGHGPTGTYEPGGLPIWRVPSGERGMSSLAVVARPANASGPVPVAILAHGSTEMASERAGFPLPVYPILTDWLVRAGLCVLSAQRPGHGETGGPYRETHGACGSPEYVRAGRATARALAAHVRYIQRQSFVPVDPARVIVIGVSAGGFGALALAADPPPGLTGIVAFAPGRGGRSFGEPGRVCAPDRLVRAMAAFGRGARVPALILSSENDTFFPVPLARRMADAFGPAARFRPLPAIAPDGHMVAEVPEGVPLWESDMRSSLKQWGILR